MNPELFNALHAPEVTRALELRQQLSKTSVKKVRAILDRVSEDARVRYGYKYYGAHTGRWSGEGVQMQNLKRPFVQNVDAAVDHITLGRDLRMFGETPFGNPLDVVSSCIRGAFQAPDGYKLVVADLSSIETRVLAWLSKCVPLLEVFERGLDPYIDFGSFWFNKPYAEVTKGERQLSKPAVLGCGYMLSGGDYRLDCCGKLRDMARALELDQPYCKCAEKGDEFKSGLWGYAENMGTALTYEQSHEAVRAYRDKYREVVNLWYKLEDAAIDTVIEGTPRVVYGINFGVVPGKVLWFGLPSGRRLHYLNPELEAGKYSKPKLTYYTYDVTSGWIRESLYGGLITENLVQAISRDVLAVGMLRADDAGFSIAGHTHDEIISLEYEHALHSLDQLIALMTMPMPWAPDLQLKAEGYEGRVYKK